MTKGIVSSLILCLAQCLNMVHFHQSFWNCWIAFLHTSGVFFLSLFLIPLTLQWLFISRLTHLSPLFALLLKTFSKMLSHHFYIPSFHLLFTLKYLSLPSFIPIFSFRRDDTSAFKKLSSSQALSLWFFSTISLHPKLQNLIFLSKFIIINSHCGWRKRKRKVNKQNGKQPLTLLPLWIQSNFMPMLHWQALRGNGLCCISLTTTYSLPTFCHLDSALSFYQTYPQDSAVNKQTKEFVVVMPID